MFTIILLTTLTQLIIPPEQEFNLTIPNETLTTTTLEPLTFYDDESSGESNDFVPKKGKKSKKSGKKGYALLNSSNEYFEETTTPNNSNILIGMSIGIMSTGLIVIIYKIKKRKSSYEMINSNNLYNYGSTDGSW
jgi:hypothetical protein